MINIFFIEILIILSDITNFSVCELSKSVYCISSIYTVNNTFRDQKPDAKNSLQ